jgi:hypothetical protein
MGNTTGIRHANLAVLGRESNDVRTNPFAHTLSGGVVEMRGRLGETALVDKFTNKRYGIDKMTNKDLMKLRKVE